MALDREKVLQNAQKFVEKKKYDKAVLEYQKIIQEDPNDARTLLKIGDVQSKMDAYAEAVATYERVGKFYSSQGFALKAIAVYKQIREIIAKHVPQLEEKYAHITPKLADLYQQLGLTSDALAALDEVATRFQRQGRDKDAIQVFQKLVELDPGNPLPHLRLAEALSRVKDIDTAVQEFAVAASTLLKLGRRDDALKVLERLLHHKPDPAHARIAAELYLARGAASDGMQALAKLQICFQANPKDIDTLGLLAKAFTAIGQAGKALEVQKEMARIAREQGKLDLFKQIVDRLLRQAPHDEVVQQLAGRGEPTGNTASAAVQPVAAPAPAPQAPPRAPAPPQPGPGRTVTQPSAWQPPAPPPTHYEEAIEAGDEDFEYDEVSTGDIQLPEDEAFPLRPSDRPGADRGRDGGREVSRAARFGHVTDVSVGEAAVEAVADPAEDGPSPEVRAQLARVLADATSFRRARLYGRAIETLRIGLELEPRSVEAREALRDSLLEAGRNDEAVDEMIVLASLYVDALDGDTAAQHLQDVLSVDPTNERAIQMLRELGYDVVEEPVEEGSEGAEGYDDQGGLQPAEDDYVDPAAYEASPDGYDPQAPLPSYDLEEVGPDQVASYSEPAAPAARRLSAPVGELDATDDPFAGDAGAELPLPSFPLDGEAATAAGHEALATDFNDATEAMSRAPVSVPPAQASQARPSAGPDLEEALDEAEFFASRGLLDDARQILNDQLARLPGHPLIVERMAELEAQEKSQRVGSGTRQMPREGQPAAGDRSFDIAATLDAIEGLDGPTNEAAPYMNAEQQVDVEEVFAKFKEGVAKQISVDDAQAHYDLGVAYKEMALLEDAIREFEIAARDAKRECVCQSMIGMIHIERGNLNEAIDAFMRGLHAPQRTDEQEMVLSFEVGAAYEMKRMAKEALNFYERVARNDAGYRDVQERIRRLKKPEARPAQVRAAAVGADDEFDRAFDDIIGSGKLP